MSEVADRIRWFIAEDIGWEGDPGRLTDDLPLIDERVLDSIGILRMVTFLEKEYGIEVEDADVTPDRMGTLAGIDRYVQSKRLKS